MSPRRILIIDDNVELAENLAEILRLSGHVTDVARSAEEALSKVGPAAPDVVVTDYRLPGTTGVSLVRRLQALGVRANAIVISAFTDDSTLNEARSAGAAFVAKPVDLEMLGRLVEG
jgi:DNA-binding NtrC family response regulator